MLNAPLKPDVRLEHVPKRRPERKRRVTICAGMMCTDGIVICADTELTLTTMKASRAKIFITAEHLQDFRMAIAGAGDYDFCKAAIQYTEPTLTSDDTPSLENLQSAIGDAVNDVYVNHIYPNKLNSRDISLLAAMWRKGEGYRLIRTSETAVLRVDRYEVLGSGGEIAEYILKRMYSEDLTIAQAVALAIYLMAEVKQRGQGCGGETNISVLRADGEMFEVLQDQVAEYEQTMQNMNNFSRLLFYHVFDLEKSQAGFYRGNRAIGEAFDGLRGPMVMSEVLRRANPKLPEKQIKKLFREEVRQFLQRTKRGRKRQPPSPG
jgi:20S proteasome alpha/beta subunit